MKTLEQVDAEIMERKDKIVKWQSIATKKKAELANLESKRAELRHESLNGDSQAAIELATIRQAIVVGQMEVEDLEAEARDTAAEIDALLDEREEAYREQCRIEFAAASKLAMTQAEKIEAMLDQLMGIVRPHTATLDLMNKLAGECGGQAHFRLQNLERHTEAKFSGHSVNKIYKKPYPAILLSGIEGVIQQIGLPEPEAKEAVEAETNLQP